jgi:hypothetical protein
MKKAMKITLIAALVIGGATFAYAKKIDVKPMCEAGTLGWCIYDTIGEDGYSCMVPTIPPPNGDCKGMVDVVILD